MSFTETSKLLAESRRVIEEGQESNTATLLTLILGVVTSVESSIKKIEAGMENVEKIKNSVTLLSADLRSLSISLKELEKKSNLLENSVQAMSDMYDECKTENKKSANQLNQINKKVENLERLVNKNCQTISNIPNNSKEDSKEIDELKSKVLDLQCRSMKNNLVFTGLAYSKLENCENKLRGFISQELGIYHHIEFGNVHRFGRRGKNGARPIVARFIYYNDLQMVLTSAFKLRGTPFGISEQFPAEVLNRRKKLYPKMKEARQERRDVVLVRDRLYIDGEQFIPPPEETRQTGNARNSPSRLQTENNPSTSQYRRNSDDDFHRTPSRPYKRFRKGSSPQQDDGHE